MAATTIKGTIEKARAMRSRAPSGILALGILTLPLVTGDTKRTRNCHSFGRLSRERDGLRQARTGLMDGTAVASKRGTAKGHPME
jgi:hypothetical protein